MAFSDPTAPYTAADVAAMTPRHYFGSLKSILIDLEPLEGNKAEAVPCYCLN